MKLAIVLFALLVCVMAAALALRPRVFMDFILRHADALWLHLLAAGVRIALGIVLIMYAPESRFPLTLQILGWIALLAGITLAVLPPARFKQLMHWAFGKFGRYTRMAAVAALLFGIFLIYAVT